MVNLVSVFHYINTTLIGFVTMNYYFRVYPTLILKTVYGESTGIIGRCKILSQKGSFSRLFLSTFHSYLQLIVPTNS